MKTPNANTTGAMRQDWDERARKDPFHYVADWRQDWTVETFLSSGEEEYRKLVDPVLQEFQVAPERLSMLEVGCGAGRMTASCARRFASVYALDISEEMQNLAKQNLRGLQNIHWIIGNGIDLSPIGDEAVDFVFSYLVLQHLPTEELVLTYVREMLRVLKNDGIFLFQFNGQNAPTMNWKGRLAWQAVDSLWALNLRKLSQATARSFGFDPAKAGKSWRGAAISADKIANAVSSAGGSYVQMSGKDTPMAWCRGRKSAGRAL